MSCHALLDSDWHKLPSYGPMDHFSRNLYTFRKARALTQSHLAALLNVQPRLVSRWETGETKPHFEHMLRLARVLEVSLDQLANAGEEVAEGPGFEIRNLRLKELCRQVDELQSEDQEVVCHLMDSLVRKQKLEAAAQVRNRRQA